MITVRPLRSLARARVTVPSAARVRARFGALVGLGQPRAVDLMPGVDQIGLHVRDMEPTLVVTHVDNVRKKPGGAGATGRV